MGLIGRLELEYDEGACLFHCFEEPLWNVQDNNVDKDM